MKETTVILVLAAVALALGSTMFFFDSDRMGNDLGSESAAAMVAFDPLVSGVTSSITKRTNYLITSEAELRQLWSMLGREGAPPKIDFTSRSVVAVFAGEQPTAGYSIAVSDIKDTADARTVTVTVSRPGGSCVPAQVLTSPYQIVAVPATTLRFAHKDVSATVSCLE